MTIRREQTGSDLLIQVEGRLDTTTAPQLEKELENLEGVTALVLELAALEYIASAGLRVLLTTQKRMNRQGTLTLRHVNETVMEVLEITGFSDILTIEP